MGAQARRAQGEQQRALLTLACRGQRERDGGTLERRRPLAVRQAGEGCAGLPDIPPGGIVERSHDA